MCHRLSCISCLKVKDDVSGIDCVLTDKDSGRFSKILNESNGFFFKSFFPSYFEGKCPSIPCVLFTMKKSNGFCCTITIIYRI